MIKVRNLTFLMCLIAFSPLFAGNAVANDVGGDQTVSTPIFVTLEPIHLPVISSDGRVKGYVFVLVSLEVANDEIADEIKIIAPRFHHALLRAAYGKRIGRKDSPERVDAGVLKRRLLPAAQGVKDDITVDSIIIINIHPDKG